MQPELVRIIGRTAIGSGIALSLEERARHAYLVGKSGSGKSTTLFDLAMHDITAGEGVAVIDRTASSRSRYSMPCRPRAPMTFAT